MSRIMVRRAVKADSERLAELADELIHLDDWAGREAMLKRSLEDPSCRIYVAEVDEKQVGFIELRVFPDFVEGRPIAIIQNMIVDEEYRKIGVGSVLIRSAIEEAEERNAIEIHVSTESDNLQAINFYTRHGFKERSLLLEREMRAQSLHA